MDASTFSSNLAVKNGGGLYSYLAEVTINNTLFKDNNASVGGALRSIKINATIDNVSYQSNKASLYADNEVNFCVIGEYKTDYDCIKCSSGLY